MYVILVINGDIVVVGSGGGDKKKEYKYIKGHFK